VLKDIYLFYSRNSTYFDIFDLLSNNKKNLIILKNQKSFVNNNRIFKGVQFDIVALVDIVKLNSFLWLKTNQPSFDFCYHD